MQGIFDGVKQEINSADLVPLSTRVTFQRCMHKGGRGKGGNKRGTASCRTYTHLIADPYPSIVRALLRLVRDGKQRSIFRN